MTRTLESPPREAQISQNVELPAAHSHLGLIRHVNTWTLITDVWCEQNNCMNLTFAGRHGSRPLSIHLTLHPRGRCKPVTPGATKHGPSSVARIVFHQGQMWVVYLQAGTNYGHTLWHRGRPPSWHTEIKTLNSFWKLTACTGQYRVSTLWPQGKLHRTNLFKITKKFFFFGPAVRTQNYIHAGIKEHSKYGCDCTHSLQSLSAFRLLCTGWSKIN